MDFKKALLEFVSGAVLGLIVLALIVAWIDYSFTSLGI